MINENLQTVMTNIEAILNDTNHNKAVEAVLNRLVSFGYEPVEDDAWVIAFAIQKVSRHIEHQTNQNTVPDGLFEVYVDMVCGEFLYSKYLAGTLTMENLDFEGIVNSVSEGDTSVTFETSGQDEDKFNKLIRLMIDGKGCDLLCYRKMQW